MDSSSNNSLPAPEVVKFESEGVKCVAFVGFDQRSLNMRSCQINLGENPDVAVNTLEPGRTRVIINDGQVWFDTSLESAENIKSLFETGKAPTNTAIEA